jgi:hypothetical protein
MDNVKTVTIVRIVEAEEAVTRPIAPPPAPPLRLPIPPAVLAIAIAAILAWLPAIVAVAFR